jgi:hypothetical protein
MLTDAKSLSQLSSIVSRLQSEYDCSLLGSWRVDYRLLRSTPRPQPTQAPKLQHVLHLSNDPRRVFVSIEETTQPNGTLSTSKGFTLSCIPAPYASQYNNLLNQSMAAMWTHKSALSLSGSAWEIGSTVIYTGELRAHGTSQAIRAVLVAFETKIDNDDDTEDSVLVIKSETSEMARIIGIENAKEHWGHGSQRNIIQAWCAVLST